MTIPIVIPAYEPDSRLIDLLKSCEKNEIHNIIIVNDGSDEKFSEIFSEASEILHKTGGMVLVHKKNRGKGGALKTAFSYILENYPNTIGVVTADADGQHSCADIKKVRDVLANCPGSLVLGVRDFKGNDIPWKSKMGNNFTRIIFKTIVGLDIQDTQTGLRGIGKSFMEDLLKFNEDRYEFETRMLIESRNKYPITQVDIETIYDSKDQHQTHFKPLLDSLKIYKVILSSHSN